MSAIHGNRRGLSIAGVMFVLGAHRARMFVGVLACSAGDGTFSRVSHWCSRGVECVIAGDIGFVDDGILLVSPLESGLLPASPFEVCHGRVLGSYTTAPSSSDSVAEHLLLVILF